MTVGNISGSLTITGSVSDNSTPSYQWYGSANGTVQATDVAETGSGATTSSFTIPTTLTRGTYYYYCVVSGTSPTIATKAVSNVVSVVVNNTPPAVKSGEETQTGSATPAANSGNPAAVSYTADVSQWFEDADGDTLTYAIVSENADGVVDLNSTTGALTFTPTAADASSSKTIIVKANDGTADSTSNVTITVTVSDSTPITAASASVLSVTVSGTAGSALGGGQRATITLTGDTVANNLVNADASGWFTGLPAGITVTANAQAGGGTITLTCGGTPTAASTQQFVITIPGSVLTDGNPISVTANSNARFSISGTPQPPSPLPKTGDGFPMDALLALLGAALAGMGWLGWRLRKKKA